MIFKKTMDFLRALRRLCTKWTAEDFRKAGVNTNYASDITDSSLLKDAFAFVETERNLAAAAEALRQIECLTQDEPEEISKMVHVIAQNGWREATK